MTEHLANLPIGTAIKDPKYGRGALAMVDRTYHSNYGYFHDKDGNLTTLMCTPGTVAEGALKDVLDFIPAVSSRMSTSTSGSDPEIFVFNKEGIVIPAWEFLPEKSVAEKTGKSVYELDHFNESSYAYWDGVQAEITTRRGYNCHAYMTDSIQLGLKKIYRAAMKHDPNAVLRTCDVVTVPNEILFTGKEEHVALGCAPSQNIHNIPPIDVGDPRHHTLRYSGTHLHFRHASVLNADDPRLANYPINILKMLDSVLGVVLTAMGRGLEDPRRRLAYGRPGEYRLTDPPKAGLEYRTPGAFLMSCPQMFNLAADIGRRAYHLGLNFTTEQLGLGDVTEIIMNADADSAVKYIQANKPLFEGVVRACSYGNRAVLSTMNAFERGLTAVKGKEDVVRDWVLKGSWSQHDNNNAATWNTFAAKL